MSDFSQSFLPVIGDAPRVLILGTLPSRVSLQKQEYYGHPRNHFWKIIFALFGGDFHENYQFKTAFVKEKRIAIWDVCYTAVRPGSLDAGIKAEQPNRIDELMEKHATISMIAFNGKKAEQLYLKHFKKKAGIRYVSLLSSSPANAVYSLDQKIEDWQVLMP